MTVCPKCNSVAAVFPSSDIGGMRAMSCEACAIYWTLDHHRHQSSELPFAAEIDAAWNRHFVGFVGFVGHGEARHAFRRAMLPVLEALTLARGNQRTEADVDAYEACQRLRGILEVPSGESLEDYAREAHSGAASLQNMDRLVSQLRSRLSAAMSAINVARSYVADGLSEKVKP